MNKEFVEYLKGREDVSCLLEYFTPRVKAKAKGIGTAAGKKAGMFAGRKVVRRLKMSGWPKGEEKLPTRLRKVVEIADDKLNPPKKEEPEKKTVKPGQSVKRFLIDSGLMYDLSTPKLRKKHEKRMAKLAKRKKPKKAPFKMRLAGELMLPLIEKMM